MKPEKSINPQRQRIGQAIANPMRYYFVCICLGVLAWGEGLAQSVTIAYIDTMANVYLSAPSEFERQRNWNNMYNAWGGKYSEQIRQLLYQYIYTAEKTQKHGKVVFAYRLLMYHLGEHSLDFPDPKEIDRIYAKALVIARRHLEPIHDVLLRHTYYNIRFSLNPREAITSYEQLCAEMHQKGYLEMEILLLNHMGQILKNTNTQLLDIPNSLRYLLQALALVEQQPPGYATAYTYAALSDSHYRSQNLEIALDFAVRALWLFEHTGILNEYMYYNACTVIGLVHRQNKQYDSANFYFKKKLRVARQYRNYGWQGIAEGNIGGNYFFAGRYADALPYYRKSVKEQGNTTEYHDWALSHLRLSRIYLELGQKDSAQTVLQKAKQLINTYGIRVFDPLYYEMEALLSAALGDYARAYRAHTRFKKLSDSLQVLMAQRSVNDIQVRFDLAQEKREKETLQEQQRWQVLVIGLVLGALVVFIALSILLYRSNLKRRDAIRQLARTNQAKNQIISIISHDFRAPLASLRGLLSLTQEDGLTDEEVKVLLHELSKRTNITAQMVEKLLQWAKTQMEGITPQPSDVHIIEIVCREIELLSTQAQEKDISIDIQIQDDLWAWADPDQTHIVVRNLISNALKFTPRGGNITLKATQMAQGVCVEVADTGIGIAPKDLEDLFKPKIHRSRYGTQGEAGTGLGLPLCKELVEANGGQIWAESQENQGSQFFFTLPSRKG